MVQNYCFQMKPYFYILLLSSWILKQKKKTDATEIKFKQRFPVISYYLLYIMYWILNN